MQIKNRWDGNVICEGEESIKKLAEKNKANLSGANLAGADLSWANLSRANLSRANLSEANLSGAYFSGADLSGANLSWANLSRANLSRANLSEADLSWANLSWANLSRADLSGAYFSGANLSEADLSWADLSRAKNIEFYNLSFLATLAKINLYNLPDDLQLELMRRDAQSHPHPELFDEWVKTGKCPYQNEERFWLFEPKPELWKPGKPEISDYQLILEICKSQGWKIRNYLK